MTQAPIRYVPVLLMIALTSAHAAVCTVPGAYGSIQSAVNDSDCTDIQVAEGTYQGSVIVSRTLNLVGAGSGLTTIQGGVTASGNSTNLVFQGFQILNGCPGSAISSNGAAMVAGFDIIAENSDGIQCYGEQDLIFSDGFEN